MAAIPVTCPQCGAHAVYAAKPLLDTGKNPTLIEKVRDSRAFLWRCPHCGYETHMDYSFLYREREKNLLLYYAADESSYRAAYARMTGRDSSVDWNEMKTAKRRIVTSHPRFLEKLLILDEGLDDRVVEIMKGLAFVTLSQKQPDIHPDTVLFDRGSDGNHYFRFDEKGKTVAAYAFERPLYNKMQTGLTPLFPKLNPEDVVINAEWASKTLTALQQM